MVAGRTFPWKAGLSGLAVVALLVGGLLFPFRWRTGERRIPAGGAGGEGAAGVLRGFPGRFTVAPAAANGGRPVAVLLPPGFDPARPCRMVVVFHGRNGELARVLGSTHGIADWAASARGDAAQTVLVVPQGPRRIGEWMRSSEGESFSGLRREAEEAAARAARGPGALGPTGAPAAAPVPLRVVALFVVAHSGGGHAIRNACMAGDLVGVARLDLLDALYDGTGAAVARWASRLANREVEIRLVVSAPDQVLRALDLRAALREPRRVFLVPARGPGGRRVPHGDLLRSFFLADLPPLRPAGPEGPAGVGSMERNPSAR